MNVFHVRIITVNKWRKCSMFECTVKKHGSAISQDGKEVKLTYGLVVSQVSIGHADVETYGVAVYAECDGMMSCEMIEDISPSLAEIENLIEKLCSFKVTPITLKDIINDYIEN